MSSTSNHPSNHNGPPLRANMPGKTASQGPPIGHHVRVSWLSLLRWLQSNTFVPHWLPEPLRHPFISYLIAALLEVAAVVAIQLIYSAFPMFAFRGVLVTVVVVLVALGGGAGPSLLATFVGTFLIYYTLLPPYFTWALADPADALGLLMYLVVGICISLLAGRSERARRQAEEQSRLLAQARARSALDYQRLRTVLDVLPSAVIIAGPQGQMLQVNPALRTLWGDDISQAADIEQYTLYKARWARSGKPLTPEEWTLARALTRGEVILNDEIEIETLDGQRKIILNSAAPIRDETGAITGAVVSAQDISEVRRLEQEVADRAAALETTFEAITDGIGLLDMHGYLLKTNRAFRALFGLEQYAAYTALPAYQQMAMLDARDEQGQPLAPEAWPVARLLQGETLAGTDLLVKSLDGRELVVNVSGAPIRDVHGHYSGCVEVFRDVTERRRLEQRTREALNALVAMAEAMVQEPQPADAAALADETSLLSAEAVPPGAAKRLAELTRSVLGCRRVSLDAIEPESGVLRPLVVVGLSPKQERAWWASWSPPQRLEGRFGARIATALYTGEPVPLDVRHTPEQYQYTLYQARSGLLMPLRMGEELIGILCIDYGEREHAFTFQEEMALIRAISRLGALLLERDRLLRRWAEARANELTLRATKEQMDTFLGMVSHELKTPLTSIRLALQISQKRMKKLAPLGADMSGIGPALAFFQNQLVRTEGQVERLDRLVNDLLEASRIQAGKLELRLQCVDLVALVRQVVEEQREAAPGRVITLRVPADLPATVDADPVRIEQVVANYLTNALKYSLEDRPVDVGMCAWQQKVCIWVRDQGPGLPPEEQERVWERFHRARGIEIQSGTGIGLGLGLYICRTIIERHQGQVGVESVPGKGCTFWFTLPLNARPGTLERADGGR
jgi:PAS domain S-box-containing protein